MTVRRISESSELYHFGIKGQKWGVRHYQNPDGTLTDSGKARYYKYASKEVGAVENRLSDIQKRYDRKGGRLQKKIDKRALKGKNIERLQRKFDKEKTRYETGKDICEKELNVLKDYTLSDYIREEHDMKNREQVKKIRTMTITSILMGQRPGILPMVVAASGDARNGTMANERTQYRLKQNKLSDDAYALKIKRDNTKNKKRAEKYDKRLKKQIKKDNKRYDPG